MKDMITEEFGEPDNIDKIWQKATWFFRIKKSDFTKFLQIIVWEAGVVQLNSGEKLKVSALNIEDTKNLIDLMKNLRK